VACITFVLLRAALLRRKAPEVRPEAASGR